MGPPKRPNIIHDTGFASLPRRTATASDYLYLAKWKAMLEGAEILRPDLTDAVAAYRHFLNGEGKPRRFSYDRYVMNDASGQVTLRNAILDFQFAAIYAWLTTNLPYISSHFPYPATENWQKAIGAHAIWLSGSVDIITNAHDARGPLFKCQMTLHAEDRYNFNPGDQDIATSAKDEENGRFEQTRLAFGFDHFSELSRYLEWRGTDLGVALSAKPNTTRLRQPPNNRQVANRI